MIAKCTVLADTREKALQRLSTVLRDTVLVGVSNNLAYLSKLALTDDFSEDRFSTKTISLTLDSILQQIEEERTALREISKNLSLPLQGFRSSAAEGGPLSLAAFAVTLDQSADSKLETMERSQYYSPRFPKRLVSFCSLKEKNTPKIKILYGLTVWTSELRAEFICQGGLSLLMKEQTFPSFEQTPAQEVQGGLAAKVPGKIILVAVSQGDTVKKGDRIAVLESMKMEYDLIAASSGKVSEVLVRVGEQVEAGKLVCVLDSEK